MIQPLTETSDRAVADRPQCPKMLLVGLGWAGRRVLQQVARRVHELRPASLSLTRFLITAGDDGAWEVLNGADMAARQLPEPTPTVCIRQQVYQGWRARIREGCYALQRAAFAVMDPDARERVVEQGFDVLPSVEVFVVGDLVDPICNAVFLSLLQTLREQTLPDVSFVTHAVLSVARLSDPTLSSDEQAMTYAALKELNFAMSETADSPANGQPKWSSLLDHCYLADQVLQGDATEAVPCPELVLELIGGFLSGILLSNLRTLPDAARLFQPRWREKQQVPENVGLAASLGYAAMTMPVGAVASYISHLEARRLIRYGLKESEGDQQVSRGDYPNLAEMLELSPQSISGRLRRTADGDPLSVNMNIQQIQRQQALLLRWPNRLRHIIEIHEQGPWNQILGTLRDNERVETERVLNRMRQAIDDTIRTRPLGWQLTEQMMLDLDKRIEALQGDLPPRVPVPDPVSMIRRLRQVIATSRSIYAVIPHLLLISLLALWSSLLAPLGWFFAVPVLLVGAVWLIWSQWARLTKGRLLRQVIEILESYFQVRLENEVLDATTRFYRTLREALGYKMLPEENPDGTERVALRRWRDTLTGAIAALAHEPNPPELSLPYGEREAIRPEEYGLYYRQYTNWSAEEIAAEFLRHEFQVRGDDWSWRDLDAGTLVNRVREFCEIRYLRAFDEARLSLASSLDLVGRGHEDHLKFILRQLRLRSEPLIRRSQHLSLSDQSRRRFLLLHGLGETQWAHLGQEEGLVPTFGSPAIYMAVLQMELGIALTDLLILPRLKRAYETLPDRSVAHGDPAWMELPDPV